MMQEYYFADMHLHMLQGVDDGARDEITAVNMFKAAYADGTRIFILTPHFHGGFMQTGYEANETAFERFKKLALETYPDAKLYLGNEIYYFDSLPEWLDERKIHTMAGSRYVLLEFANAVTERELKNAVRQMVVYDYYPVLAHVNRYDVLVNNTDLVYELINLGAYIQLNTEALRGDAGYRVRKFSQKLLRNEAVHFIASDAHSTKSRPPLLSESFRHVEHKYGREMAEALFYKNTIHVIENRII